MREDDDEYVFGGARPYAEIHKGETVTISKTSTKLPTVEDGSTVDKSNGAGIDLFPRTAQQLGIGINQNVNVDWKFIEPPF